MSGLGVADSAGGVDLARSRVQADGQTAGLRRKPRPDRDRPSFAEMMPRADAPPQRQKPEEPRLARPQDSKHQTPVREPEDPATSVERSDTLDDRASAEAGLASAVTQATTPEPVATTESVLPNMDLDTTGETAPAAILPAPILADPGQPAETPTSMPLQPAAISVPLLAGQLPTPDTGLQDRIADPVPGSMQTRPADVANAQTRTAAMEGVDFDTTDIEAFLPGHLTGSRTHGADDEPATEPASQDEPATMPQRSALPPGLSGSIAGSVLAASVPADRRGASPPLAGALDGTAGVAPGWTGGLPDMAAAPAGLADRGTDPGSFDIVLGTVDPGHAPQATTTLQVATGGKGADLVPIGRLAVEIATKARAGEKRFDIRLDPPELGRIDVSLTIDRDGTVKSHLIVEKSETLDLLRRDAPNLERALQHAGMKLPDGASVEFSLRDSGRDGTGGQQARRDDAFRPDLSDDEAEAATPPPVTAIYARPAGPARGLDIRI